MSLFISFFNTFLYRPLFNGLILIYNVVPGHDLGIAIIILTVLIKLIFAPLSKKAIQSQKAMTEIQPKIKELQKKYKDNKEEQVKEIMALYKQHKVNPMSGCLPLLIQFPIIIALYKVFLHGMDGGQLSVLYNFVSRPQTLNVMFLGIVNLSSAGNIILAVLAGGFQFIQTKMMMPNKKQSQNKSASGGLDMMGSMMNQMTFMMPIITVYIAWKLPAALALYWIVFTVFGIVQQYFTPNTI
ncbi:YidC/Oxa1 family membrane protein insertase [Patescibacteria group bacterium]